MFGARAAGRRARAMCPRGRRPAAPPGGRRPSGGSAGSRAPCRRCRRRRGRLARAAARRSGDATERRPRRRRRDEDAARHERNGDPSHAPRTFPHWTRILAGRMTFVAKCAIAGIKRPAFALRCAIGSPFGTCLRPERGDHGPTARGNRGDRDGPAPGLRSTRSRTESRRSRDSPTTSAQPSGSTHGRDRTAPGSAERRDSSCALRCPEQRAPGYLAAARPSRADRRRGPARPAGRRGSQARAGRTRWPRPG